MNKKAAVEKTFYREVIETLSRIIQVGAKEEPSALLMVAERYRQEVIVLNAEDYIETEFKVLK